MPPLPKRVVRRARPSKHSVHEQERNNRYNHHSPGFAPHMRHGIQRYLPALGRRFIASHLGDQSVRRFVTRRRKQKRDIPNESENENIGSEIRQVIGPFPQLSPSRLEVVTLLCKQGRAGSITATSTNRLLRISVGAQEPEPVLQVLVLAKCGFPRCSAVKFLS